MPLTNGRAVTKLVNNPEFIVKNPCNLKIFWDIISHNVPGQL